MEEIQFLNYILSILAVLLAAWAAWNTFRHEDKTEWQIKDIREQIRLLRNSQENKKR
jgi:phage baseplate assembly protein gpV